MVFRFCGFAKLFENAEGKSRESGDYWEIICEKESEGREVWVYDSIIALSY